MYFSTFLYFFGSANHIKLRSQSMFEQANELELSARASFYVRTRFIYIRTRCILPSILSYIYKLVYKLTGFTVYLILRIGGGIPDVDLYRWQKRTISLSVYPRWNGVCVSLYFINQHVPDVCRFFTRFLHMIRIMV